LEVTFYFHINLLISWQLFGSFYKTGYSFDSAKRKAVSDVLGVF
jgi:hypothetical protein